MSVIKLHKCLRCGKTWFPRTPGTPRICPTCKTTYWNKKATDKRNTALREMLQASAASSSVARWDFQKITMGQLQEAVDTFYGDFRNKAVEMSDALKYVCDQLQGKPTAELEKELESIRAAARE